MGEPDPWSENVDELIEACWLSPSLDGSHEDEMWGRVADDLARIEREVEFAMLGEGEARTAHAPGTLNQDARRIAKAADTLVQLLRRSRPLLRALAESDPANEAHCSACGHIEGGISPRYWTQPIDTDASALAEMCRQHMAATEGRRAPRRRKSTSYWLHGALWIFRNHVARLVTLRPDLLPLNPGRETAGVVAWEPLASDERERVWRDALLVQGEHEVEFVLVACRAFGESIKDTEAVSTQLVRYPYPSGEHWRSADFAERPDRRDPEGERVKRDRERARPLFVPGFDYSWG